MPGNLLCNAAEIGDNNFQFIINGDMEMLDTSYRVWTGSNNTETQIVHGGEKSMRFSLADGLTSDTNLIYTQNITGIVAGESYTLCAYVYNENLEIIRPVPYAGIGTKFEFFDKNGTVLSQIGPFYEMTTIGQWEQISLTADAPAQAVSASIHIRIRGCGGTVYFDDVSVTGPVSMEEYPILSEKNSLIQTGFAYGEELYEKQQEYYENASIAPYEPDLILNGSFETSHSSSQQARPKNWAQNGAYNYICEKSTEEARTGTYSLKISNYDESIKQYDPYGSQTIHNDTFYAGTEYLLSSWIKTADYQYGGGAFYKIDIYDSNNKSIGVYASKPMAFDDGDWHKMNFTFTLLENAAYMIIYVRLEGLGTLYYDDVALGKTNINTPLEFYTKHTFYYTDENNIEAFADIKTPTAGSSINYSLNLNGEVVSSFSLPADEHTSWVFPSSQLASEKTKYVISVEYRDENGDLISKKSKNIYRFDRPKTLNENGDYLIDGKRINPFFIYKSNYPEDFEDYAAAGVMVIRECNMNIKDDSSILSLLDAAENAGIKLLISLYSTLPAGHPLQIPLVKHVVSTFKDHPAVFGWMLMDEPSLQVSHTGIRTYDEALYYLEEGYKVIRNIDDVHPVYCVETIFAVPDSYQKTSQMCDIFAIDPYPGSFSGAMNGYIEKLTTNAVNAVYDERPVYMLGLAADWTTYGETINSDMLRHQIYAALLNGAKGAGHYLSTPSNPDYNGEAFNKIYKDTFISANESGELDAIFDHFSAGKGQIFAKNTAEGYKWYMWADNSGELYLIIMSNSTETVNAEFDLISSDNSVPVDGFEATLINGNTAASISSENNNFSVPIGAGEVSLYKIQPDVAINYNFAYVFDNMFISGNETSTVINYDVRTNYNCGGKLFYAFYGHDGELVHLISEDADFSGNTTVSKTFENFDFEKVCVFVWNSYGGLIPVSNRIELENIKKDI